MLIEVHEWSILLLLRGRRRHATGHGHSLGVEVVPRVVHRLPVTHDCDLGWQGMTAFPARPSERKVEDSLSAGMLAMNTWVARGSE
jgi:hypothetical protein